MEVENKFFNIHVHLPAPERNRQKIKHFTAIPFIFLNKDERLHIALVFNIVNIMFRNSVLNSAI